LQSILSNSRVFRQFVCLVKTIELWSASLSSQDDEAFSKIITSYKLTKESFFIAWWKRLLQAAKDLDKATGNPSKETTLVTFVNQVKDAISLNVFDVDVEDEANDEPMVEITSQDMSMEVEDPSPTEETIADSIAQISHNNNDDDDEMIGEKPSKIVKASKRKETKAKKANAMIDSYDDDVDEEDNDDMFVPDADIGDDDYEEGENDAIEGKPTRSTRSRRIDNEDYAMLDDDDHLDDDAMDDDDDDDGIIFAYTDKKKRKKAKKLKLPEDTILRISKPKPAVKPAAITIVKSPKPKKSTSARESILKMLSKK
jgi:hypothetical protein